MFPESASPTHLRFHIKTELDQVITIMRCQNEGLLESEM